MGKLTDHTWGNPEYSDEIQEDAIEEDEHGWNPDEGEDEGDTDAE